MARRELCSGEPELWEPWAGVLHQPRFSGAEEADGMKKTAKMPFFFKFIKKNIGQNADRKNCSLVQKVWVKCSCLFFVFVFQSQITYYDDFVKKESSGDFSGLNHILSQKTHQRRSYTGGLVSPNIFLSYMGPGQLWLQPFVQENPSWLGSQFPFFLLHMSVFLDGNRIWNELRRESHCLDTGLTWSGI